MRDDRYGEIETQERVLAKFVKAGRSFRCRTPRSLKKMEGGKWQPVGDTGISKTGVTRLFVDGQGTPIVSYPDGSGGWVVKAYQ